MTDVLWSPFAIGIGANLADRSGQIARGVSTLGSMEEIRDLRVSPPVSTEPILPDGERSDHPSYLNAVAIGRTSLDACVFMSRLLALESMLGRRRSGGCTPRTLDLDLLLFADRRIDRPGLRLPHPRLTERDFVLEPLRVLLGGAGADPVWSPLRAYVGHVG